VTRLVPDVAFATAVAALLAATALVGYDAHAGLLTLAILAPLGWLTVLVTDRLVVHRRRLGSLRRQFAAVGLVGALQLAAAVALFIAFMFVSSHDAFHTILVAAYAAALALWAAARMGRRALGDVEAIRGTLTAVGEGRRDLRTGVTGSDEVARLAADVDAMVARLDREERMRRTLFAAVSHDLRTPVTALQLLANAIDDDMVDAEVRREYAARMGTHVRALGTLIDDLFDLTRLQSGELEWTMEQVSVDLLLQEAVDAMRPAAEAEAVSMSARLDSALGAARANPEQLQRVLFNLIQNAIRHTPPDGSVTVSAEAVEGAIEVEVADTGRGIPGEQRDRVFDPFFRGDAARQDEGAGLGLAISRAIVEAHGGQIWLEDAPVGTRVRFRLPSTGLQRVPAT
jgi:signal transduction histidine kinase